jgi:hypothetical protein
MFRQLLASLLGAELEPLIDWSKAQDGQVLCRISAEVPRWKGRETVEQILSKSGDEFLLRKRSGERYLSQVQFSAPLDATAMRLIDSEPGPPRVCQLQLSPRDAGTVSYSHSWRTWFGLWQNESHDDLGAGLCFLESNDREQLKQLRSQLLGGNVPEALTNEEEMWERMNALPEAERRGALAALAMRSLAAVDQKFHETYPDAGPVPADLQPAFAAIQQRVQAIQQTADTSPPTPELAAMMQQFVKDATKQKPTGPKSLDS